MLTLVFFTNVVQAQVTVNGTMPVVDQQVVFGSQNVNHGFIRVTTAAEKFNLSALVLRARECSNWNAANIPHVNLSLSYGPAVYPGIVSIVDGEPVVTFGIGEIQGPNTTKAYTVLSDVVDYASFVEADKQCLRLTLDRAGIISKSPVTGAFPIRMSAKTFVRSKPTVTITTIGATTNRVRTTNDDVFRINIYANQGSDLLLKEIGLEVFGSAQQGGYFTVIDDANGEAIGRGWLSAHANIAWELFGEPHFSELYVLAGATRSFRIRVTSTNFQNNPNTPDALSIQIGSPCDVQWDTNYANTGGPGLCLEPQVVPITATVSYE